MVEECSSLPVVTVYFERLKSMLNGEISREKLIDTIPYLGLDIEEEADEYLRIEYNPNRPDFSTDYGLARALNSFLEFHQSWDDYKVSHSGVVVNVDNSVAKVRPHLVASLISGVDLDEESIRQVISMQEDIHNGIGRRRRKVSLGIHNFEVLKPPIDYLALESDFSFTPLHGTEEKSISEILAQTEVGQEYAHILSGSELYPILRDAGGTVLSFPPIINGDATKLTGVTRSLFIEVTATDLNAAQNALSVMVTTLADAGGKISDVTVNYRDKNKNLVAPDLRPQSCVVNLDYANSLLGLELDAKQVIECLRRSRIPATSEGDRRILAWVPRYRFDLLHEVDLVEEIAIGYGVNNIKPTFPEGDVSGVRERSQIVIGKLKDCLSGLGLIEVLTFSLVGREMLSNSNLDNIDSMLRVTDAKTAEHEILRKSLLPSMLAVLSRNIHKEYPQKVFEISTVFSREGDHVKEKQHLVVALAHTSANFTEVTSHFVAVLSQTLNVRCEVRADKHPSFSEGRTGGVFNKGKKIGYVGEVLPKVSENFGLRVPVAAFEIDLEPFL